MKKLIISSIFTMTFSLTGCAHFSQTESTIANDVKNALYTSANVLQQLNTGLQTVAPTVSALLTMTHNQGDADAVNNVAKESNALTPALAALLNSVQTAISSTNNPSTQITAVNVALSPSTVSAIVAPIQAASN